VERQGVAAGIGPLQRCECLWAPSLRLRLCDPCARSISLGWQSWENPLATRPRVALTNRPSFLGNAACRQNAARAEGFKVLRRSRALVEYTARAIRMAKVSRTVKSLGNASCRYQKGLFSRKATWDDAGRLNSDTSTRSVYFASAVEHQQNLLRAWPNACVRARLVRAPNRGSGAKACADQSGVSMLISDPRTDVLGQDFKGASGRGGRGGR
jgi:hypothetical protein